MVEYTNGRAQSCVQPMVWLCTALALAVALSDCASEDTYAPRGGSSGANSAGSVGVGGDPAGTAGTVQASAGQGGNPVSSGGGGSSGASSGGTGGGAHAGAGGTAGSAGNAAGGTAQGGAGNGGSGGHAGNAGNAAGGTNGGSAGQGGGNAGSAGSGGTGSVHCTDHPIPTKSSWTVTASSADAGSPLANATDGNLATRWSTGVSQSSDWLQVDFGVPTALDSITLMLGASAGDYPRAYQVRVSNNPQDNASSPLATGNGQQATDTLVTFATPALGRYLLISQTGSINGTWWSVAELTLACTH